MRSPIGPFLVLLGLATVVVLVLVLFQTIGLRSDLDGVRAELGALQAAVAEQEPGLSEEQLDQRLDELEADIQGFTGTTDPGATDSTGVADRLDEILERIQALDRRIDEICENVPVC